MCSGILCSVKLMCFISNEAWQSVDWIASLTNYSVEIVLIYQILEWEQDAGDKLDQKANDLANVKINYICKEILFSETLSNSISTILLYYFETVEEKGSIHGE